MLFGRFARNCFGLCRCARWLISASRGARLKLVATGAERREALRLADIFKAQVSDTTFESFVFTMVGSPPKVASFVSLMSRLGKVELARSGSVALSRGMALLEEGEGVNPCRVAS